MSSSVFQCMWGSNLFLFWVLIICTLGCSIDFKITMNNKSIMTNKSGGENENYLLYFCQSRSILKYQNHKELLKGTVLGG